MNIKTTVYVYESTAQVQIPHTILQKYDLNSNLKLKLGSYVFLAKPCVSTKLNKDGSVSKRIIIVIPKKIALDLELRNREDIHLRIL